MGQQKTQCHQFKVSHSTQNIVIDTNFHNKTKCLTNITKRQNRSYVWAMTSCSQCTKQTCLVPNKPAKYTQKPPHTKRYVVKSETSHADNCQGSYLINFLNRNHLIVVSQRKPASCNSQSESLRAQLTHNFLYHSTTSLQQTGIDVLQLLNLINYLTRIMRKPCLECIH